MAQWSELWSGLTIGLQFEALHFDDLSLHEPSDAFLSPSVEHVSDTVASLTSSPYLSYH